MKIHAAEMEYDNAASEALRGEIIQVRDRALRDGDFNAAVLLSHVVAWMRVVIDLLDDVEGKR